MEKYSSPIGGTVQSFFNHYEIFFEIDSLFWGLLSFGADGLEARVALEKNWLVARRKNNTLIQSKKVNVPSKKLRKFLKKNEATKFHYLIWNSQHFSNALWDTIILSQQNQSFKKSSEPPSNQAKQEKPATKQAEKTEQSFFSSMRASSNSASNFARTVADISYGRSYFYNGLDQTFREKLQSGKKITCIEKYGSPVENQSLFKHHETIIAIDGGMIWGYISFGRDGLQTGAAMHKKDAIDRRKNNKLIESKNVSVPTNKLQAFLKQNEGYRYKILFWNCQHYSKALWHAIDESFIYSATDPNFLQKIQSASRITQIEKYSSPLSFSDLFYHYEIVFEIDGEQWGLISFGVDGLETSLAEKKAYLVARRKNNRLIENKKVDVPAKLLLEFFDEHDRRCHSLFWTCRQFSQALWEAIVK